MKKKFRNILSEKCKDFGLTEKAIDDLVELGSADLKDDASDEDITAKADLLVPYAKAMQGEITRKAQGKPSAKQSVKTDNKDGEREGDGEGKENVLPDWFKDYQKRLETLETENKNLKAGKAVADRNTLIAKEAKALGIPEYLVKRINISKDADIKAELTALKQDLVNDNLMPKGATHGTATTKEQMTSEEDAWAKSQPDKKP